MKIKKKKKKKKKKMRKMQYIYTKLGAIRVTKD